MTINCAKIKQSNGHVSMTVDDVLQRITINGKDVALSGNLGAWNVPKNIPVNIQEGDEVELFGQNEGGPMGIIATFYYKNRLGVDAKFSTNTNDWTCGGVKAVSFGNNGVGPWGNIAGVDASAQWIWYGTRQFAGDKTSCKTRVPRAVNGNIYITVDNYLENILVNGHRLPIENIPNILDWTKMKTIPAEIIPGDEIEIYGSNISGPAGIIATIEYQLLGETHRVSTGDAWRCSKAPAVLQGKNSVQPWGAINGIGSDAHWIWDSHQQINGDKVSCWTIVEADVHERHWKNKRRFWAHDEKAPVDQQRDAAVQRDVSSV